MCVIKEGAHVKINRMDLKKYILNDLYYFFRYLAATDNCHQNKLMEWNVFCLS